MFKSLTLEGRNATCRYLLCLLVYCLVNTLFCLKYIPAEYSAALAVVLYNVVVVAGLAVIVKAKLQDNRWLFFCGAGAVLLLAFVLLKVVDPFSIDVDRWSALYFWSENLFNGIYPYAARTHLDGYGSPFPVWQLFYALFYGLGDVGYGAIACLALLFVVLYSVRKRFNLFLFLFLLAASPAFWWEIVVRSDLMMNLFIAALFIVLLSSRPELLQRYKYLTAFCVGLLLCTRLLVGIALYMYLFSAFWAFSRREKAGFALLVVAGFVLPFIPFAIWDYDMLFHFEYSPLVLQTRQGNWWLALIGLVALSAVACFYKRGRDDFFFEAMALFLFIALAAMRLMLKVPHALFDDTFDISYFSTCLPFLLFYLSRKVEHDRI